jgi:Zn-finger nucleic acid-binding protein
MRCPACPDVSLGKDGHCSACKGVWLDEERVQEQAARALVFTGGTYSERRCPVCDEKMDEPLIFDVAIDRCAAHGMWFDKAEHAEVLHRSRSDEWRHRSGGPAATASESATAELTEVIRSWRRTAR